MPLKMKTALCMIAVIFSLCLTSCSPSPGLQETEIVETTAPSQPVLKTTMGEFVIDSSRLVDEVHDQKSAPGQKFLLVILTQPDGKKLVPGEFKLESFQQMIQDSRGQIYVSGKDDFGIISNMAGWVEDDFAMGFTVPIQESYTLYWPGNSQIELNPKQQ